MCKSVVLTKELPIHQEGYNCIIQKPQPLHSMCFASFYLWRTYFIWYSGFRGSCKMPTINRKYIIPNTCTMYNMQYGWRSAFLACYKIITNRCMLSWTSGQHVVQQGSVANAPRSRPTPPPTGVWWGFDRLCYQCPTYSGKFWTKSRLSPGWGLAGEVGIRYISVDSLWISIHDAD